MTPVLNKPVRRSPTVFDLPTEKLRVLLIEDDAAYTRLLREYLLESDHGGFDLVNVETLTQGLNRLDHERLDVILLDLSLPDSLGLETFTRIFNQHPNTPIVVLSGNDDTLLAMTAVQLGAQDYLVKGKIHGDVVPRVLRYAVGRKRVEEALRRSEEQLRQAQKMEGIGRLAGGIAHDFNNLLTSILGFGHLILHELDPRHRAHGDMLEIIQAGERAAALTRQLLAFGRKQMMLVRRLDPNAVMSGMEQLLRRTLGEDIEVTTRLGANLGSIQADAGQLEQVILNLAVNARDAMPRGGQLVIRTERIAVDETFCRTRPGLFPGEYVLIAVKDTGCGMTPEICRFAFEPFFTTKERGTGLGLSTVYGIVKQFEGYIEIESEPGQGTEFKVFLPRLDAPPEELPLPRHSETPTGRETILLVEDEDTLRGLASRILSGLGYRILEARNGVVALEAAGAHEGPIHLVLTDVVMPRMSGPEVVEQLRPSRPEFKVLYITGFTDDTIVQHGVLENQAHLILKPYTRDSLAQKVRSVLDGDLGTGER